LFGVLELFVGAVFGPNDWCVFGTVGGAGLVPRSCWRVVEDGWCGSGALASFGVFDGVVDGGGVGCVAAGGVVVDLGDDGADDGI
jgi:hypothetical protein